MITVVIVVAVVSLIVLFRFLSYSQVMPWVDQMTRLNPGVMNRAEWMAPGNVVEAVQRDYMAFYNYAAQTLPEGWIPYMRDLNQYLCGDMLKKQRESLDTRLRHDRGRMIDVVRANHNLQVRHFTGDGMTCIVIDHQSEQRLATYDYWYGYRLHTQDLGSMTYIYEMHYDLRAGRWKIARFIQTLPPGMQNTLDIHLPQTVGRDQ